MWHKSNIAAIFLCVHSRRCLLSNKVRTSETLSKCVHYCPFSFLSFLSRDCSKPDGLRRGCRVSGAFGRGCRRRHSSAVGSNWRLSESFWKPMRLHASVSANNLVSFKDTQLPSALFIRYETKDLCHAESYCDQTKFYYLHFVLFTSFCL